MRWALHAVSLLASEVTQAYALSTRATELKLMAGRYEEMTREGWGSIVESSSSSDRWSVCHNAEVWGKAVLLIVAYMFLR